MIAVAMPFSEPSPAPPCLVALRLWAHQARLRRREVGSAQDVVNKAWGTPPGESKEELAQASPVHRNELLETGGESGVEIMFVDNSKVTMGQRARLTVDEFVYADPASSKSVINLTKGAFRYVSGKMAEEKVTLKTPTATMVIRGTELKIDVADDGSTKSACSKAPSSLHR